MNMSYLFVLQNKYGIVPNCGTGMNFFFSVFSPLQPDRGINNEEVGCYPHLVRYRQTPERTRTTTHRIASCRTWCVKKLAIFTRSGTSHNQYFTQKGSTKIAKDFSVSNFYVHYCGLSSAFHTSISFCADTDRPVPHQQMKIYICQ